MRINWFNNILAICAFTLLLQFKICSAEVTEPFQGEVNTNNINVRSDATVSSKIICAVNKNDRVEVILELYEWYKIRLPSHAPSYIKKNLVACMDTTTENRCNNAKVSKNRVNIRLLPNESSPIIGVVDKNQIVNILEDKGDWYKIEPVQTSFGWINKRFVNKLPVSIAQDDVPASRAQIPASVPEENIALLGIIKPYGKIIKRIATHKLITGDNRIFLLKGNKKGLDALNYHKVKIMGKIINLPKQKYPLVEVNKLEVIN